VLAVLLSLASALGYGSSDYAAGLAGRSASVVQVTILAEAVAVAVTLAIVPWLSPQPPGLATVAWSAAGGLGGVVGAMALYLGFRQAAFSVAAPLSAVASAGFSVLAGLLFGEHPGRLALAGIALALPAIIAVSVSPRPPPAPEPAGSELAAREPATPEPAGLRAPGRRSAVSRLSSSGALWGLTAGTGFGVLFIGLNRAGSSRDLWPLAISQVTSLVAVILLGAVRGQLRLPARRASGLAVITGVTGAVGGLCYFLATHAGLLAVTAVITSLYPASTILLARLLIGERLTAVRIGGLCLAAASVGLIAASGTG
jgi:drug/metabolite transporter (DMT)-like permease